MRHKKVVQKIVMRKCHIGPLPPPLGGISVYLYRLKHLKPNDRYINSNTLGKIGFLRLLCKKKEELVLHGYNMKKLTALYFASLFLGLKYTVVLHGEGVFQRKNVISWYLLRKSLQRAQSIQFVNQKLKERMGEMFPELLSCFCVQSPFLPPPLEDEAAILGTYPKELHHFITNSSPLLVANAFKIVFWNDGTELYGLDMCVELVHRLKSQYPQIGLVFALADDSSEPDYFAKVKERILTDKLNEHIYFMTGQRELWPLFRKADLMVRPTCTDGYGISIAEALYFDCPAIASDVCVRPEGTILFNSRDMDDFYEKASEILSRKDFPLL
ncbi:glycosyltransferase [Selenomonas dianae]|uniref:glycosyltransferase n=2 Tax=Selenomonas dianae TaxID=135079 RepID=UPI00272CA505|nr:glycosyltransferase [Selenomonas dianae]WLD82862.1 glycosyltransferase [Selenomonas dianae]